MPRVLCIACFLVLLTSCDIPGVGRAPVVSPGALFFYIRQGDSPTLILLQNPDSRQSLSEIPLASPPDCSFWSLTPAAIGPWVAVEWQCAFGPAVQVVNVSTGKISFLLDDPTVDNRFLAWSPDGKSIYLKAGTLSNPQVVRVDVESRQMTVLPISPNTYNLTVSPVGGKLLYAFSNGIGSGSELWATGVESARGQKILSDPLNIIGLMRYSPDGKYIAAIRLPDDQSVLPVGELWVADSDGKNAHLAATADAGRGMPPVWSPGGEKIAFIGRTHPDDPASINLSILTFLDFKLSIFNLQPITPPVWSPDGSRLYFTLASDGKMNVWFYEISTGNTQKLFDGACCAGWTH